MLHRPRQLPATLADALRAVGQLERDASTREQRLHATAATSRLVLTALAAGWHTYELAPELGIPAASLRARLSKARQRGLIPRGGLEIPAPPRPRRERRPLDMLRIPVEEREWLTASEAARLINVSASTIRRWQALGVLPHTTWPTPRIPLYLRADILHIARGPRWRNYGVHLSVIT